MEPALGAVQVSPAHHPALDTLHSLWPDLISSLCRCLDCLTATSQLANDTTSTLQRSCSHLAAQADRAWLRAQALAQELRDAEKRASEQAVRLARSVAGCLECGRQQDVTSSRRSGTTCIILTVHQLVSPARCDFAVLVSQAQASLSVLQETAKEQLEHLEHSAQQQAQEQASKMVAVQAQLQHEQEHHARTAAGYQRKVRSSCAFGSWC